MCIHPPQDTYSIPRVSVHHMTIYGYTTAHPQLHGHLSDGCGTNTITAKDWSPPVHIAEEGAEISTKYSRKHVITSVCHVDSGRSLPGFPVCQTPRTHKVRDVSYVHSHLHLIITNIPTQPDRQIVGVCYSDFSLVVQSYLIDSASSTSSQPSGSILITRWVCLRSLLPFLVISVSSTTQGSFGQEEGNSAC